MQTELTRGQRKNGRVIIGEHLRKRYRSEVRNASKGPLGTEFFGIAFLQDWNED